MKRIYVTGQLKGINQAATKRNRHNLSLTCRKILITDNFPVCPLLACEDWHLDPRLPSSDEWWVNNYLVDFMKDCDEFCYVPLPIGIECHRLEIEKNIWRVIGNGRFLSSDVIIKYLLGGIHE
jgi:hypothetical protein